VNLFRLVYASLARPELAQDELLSILRSAKEFNTANGVTGILYYGNEAFLQVLEGDRSTVNRLFIRIANDPRNTSCEILHCGAIATRKFGDWSMRLAGFSGAQRALLLSRSGLESFRPLDMTAGQAVDFLCNLAESEREKVGLKTAS
jgi:Sensors of blue-light using FAD